MASGLAGNARIAEENEDYRAFAAALNAVTVDMCKRIAKDCLLYTSLRSMTQGRGRFESEFSHYEEVPAPMQEKIIKEANANK